MRKNLWLLWGYSLKSKSRVFSKACMITSDLTWERGEAEVGCTEVSNKNSGGIQWNICHGWFFNPFPFPSTTTTFIQPAFQNHQFTQAEVNEWAVSTDICKGFMDNPAETPPTDLFSFFTCVCARRSSCHWVEAGARALHLARLSCWKITLQLLAILYQTGWDVEKKKKNTGIGGAPFSRNTVVDRRVPQKG